MTQTAVGYTGGHSPNPTYEQVCRHSTGHAEAVEVWFDPALVSYGELLEQFWSIHNPTTRNRQGPDVGEQYRSAIYFHTPEQEQAARASLERRRAGTRREIVTEITPATRLPPRGGVPPALLREERPRCVRGDRSLSPTSPKGAT